MKSNLISMNEIRHKRNAIGWIDRIAKRILLEHFEKIAFGELTIIDGDAVYRFGERSPDFRCRARVTVNDSRFWGDIGLGGSIGSGEAYMQNLWEVDDLTSLVRIFIRNRHVLDRLDKGLARLTAPINKLIHTFRRNSRKGSKRNIAAHYDLGNDMFALFLDETMMYSCGIFEHANASMKDASEAKLDRICQKLELSRRDRLIEIGTGWGGLAIHAAKHYGCHVTTTTISREQYDYTKARVRAEGLEDRITLLLKDYRDLEGEYDKLVSIEMIEAVGHQYMDTFFRKCSSLLKPNGQMLLQAITLADQRYDEARRSVDFIQKYIFPGGFIPSVTAMSGSATRTTDMRLFHLEDIGPHYATTLRRWRERFFKNIDAIRALGYPDSFTRMWEYYLCYTEGGFEERVIGDVHMLFIKPFCRRDSILPRLDDHDPQPDEPVRLLRSA
jgi:cyclopropane-fatty-acyl-phospholipid synthase